MIGSVSFRHFVVRATSEINQICFQNKGLTEYSCGPAARVKTKENKNNKITYIASSLDMIASEICKLGLYKSGSIVKHFFRKTIKL
jgi:hypothetical protein